MERHDIAVRGVCPACQGRTLFVIGDDGFADIECSDPQCPDKRAVMRLLDESQHYHYAIWGLGGVTVQHSLHERVTGVMGTCGVLHDLAAFGDPHEDWGVTSQDRIVYGCSYRVWQDDGARWLAMPTDQGDDVLTEPLVIGGRDGQLPHRRDRGRV